MPRKRRPNRLDSTLWRTLRYLTVAASVLVSMSLATGLDGRPPAHLTMLFCVSVIFIVLPQKRWPRRGEK